MKTKLTTAEDKQLLKLRDAGEAFALALGLTRSTSFTDLTFVALGALVAQREEVAEALEEARAYSRQSRTLRIALWISLAINVAYIALHR